MRIDHDQLRKTKTKVSNRKSAALLGFIIRFPESGT